MDDSSTGNDNEMKAAIDITSLQNNTFEVNTTGLSLLGSTEQPEKSSEKWFADDDPLAKVFARISDNPTFAASAFAVFLCGSFILLSLLEPSLGRMIVPCLIGIAVCGFIGWYIIQQGRKPRGPQRLAAGMAFLTLFGILVYPAEPGAVITVSSPFWFIIFLCGGMRYFAAKTKALREKDEAQSLPPGVIRTLDTILRKVLKLIRALFVLGYVMGVGSLIYDAIVIEQDWLMTVFNFLLITAVFVVLMSLVMLSFWVHAPKHPRIRSTEMSRPLISRDELGNVINFHMEVV